MEEDGDEEAAAMVTDALLVSTPKDTLLIRLRAELQLAYDPQRALQTLSEYLQLGGGDASDYQLYGHILFQENHNAKAATAALSHAAAICEPAEKFDILVELAWCKELTGDSQGALKDLAEADSLAIGQLGVGPLTLLAVLHARNRDRASAIAALDRASLIEPLSVSIAEHRAAIKHKFGDYSGAIADLDAIISLGVNHSVAYKARGLANMQLGRFEAALNDLNQAVAKQSNKEFQALVFRATLHHRMGNLQNAVADLDTAHQIQPLSDFDQFKRQRYLHQLVETSPVIEQSTDATNDLSNADALYQQAHVRRGKGDLAGAAAALQKAAKLQPQDMRLYHECAHVHMRMSNYTEALQQLQTLMAIDSTWDVINVLRMCCVCKNKLGRHLEALADLNMAVEVHPRDVLFLQDRAFTKATLHDYNGALADVNTAIQLSPDNPVPLWRRGHILYMMGQLEAALADLDMADELRPDHNVTLMWPGFVKNNLEDWAEAIASFDEAERHDPLDENALQHRAHAKERLRIIGGPKAAM